MWRLSLYKLYQLPANGWCHNVHFNIKSLVSKETKRMLSIQNEKEKEHHPLGNFNINSITDYYKAFIKK